MKMSDLPTRWKERVERWVQAQTGGTRSRLSAGDFPTGKVVHVQSSDGSAAQFRHALVIEAPELGEVGLFTEHCGYHIFPFADTKVRIQEAK
jgi:hypothetical protein